MFLMTAAVNSEVVAEPGEEDTAINVTESVRAWEKRITGHICGANVAGVDDVESRTRDAVCEVVETTRKRPNQQPALSVLARVAYPRCLSIMVELRIIAAGFARLVPMMSLAT